MYSPQTGNASASFQLKAEGGLLRLARSSRTGSPNLLVFGVWSDPVSACSSSDGSLLWTYKNSDGVDDVWTADLDGDGRDEVIVGYNGSGGLHVLDPDGVLRWNTKLGNVWHVAAGDLTGDKKILGSLHVGRGKGPRLHAEGKTPETFEHSVLCTRDPSRPPFEGRRCRHDSRNVRGCPGGPQRQREDALEPSPLGRHQHRFDGDLPDASLDGSVPVAAVECWSLDCAKEGKPIAETQRR